MGYSIQVIRSKDFLKVHGQKNPTLQAARRALEEIGAACRERGIDRVLFDAREVEVPLTVPELYFLTSALVDIGFPRAVWIAILPRPDRFDRAQFAALCAGNRGWTARPVHSFEEGMNWFAEVEVLEPPSLPGAASEGSAPFERAAGELQLPAPATPGEPLPGRHADEHRQAG